MPRKDYDEIKKKFGKYISTWKNREMGELDAIFDNNVSAYYSTSFNPDNSQHTISGVKKFVEDMPKTDIFHSAIYNYVCRVKEDKAVQYAHVLGTALNYVENQEEMSVFYFNAMINNVWKKSNGEWKIYETRMDIDPRMGDLRKEFEKVYYFPPRLADYSNDGRLPCIQGEFDSPWYRMPDAEDVLTDEEKIKEVIAQRYYGVDHFVIDHVIDSYSKTFNCNARRYGKDEGVRRISQMLKYKRAKDRYWVHPWKLEKIVVDGNRAYAKGYRVCGYAQRNHEFVWTRSNVDVEHGCEIGHIEFVKENGQWKISYYFEKLGLFEMGKFTDDLYGD